MSENRLKSGNQVQNHEFLLGWLPSISSSSILDDSLLNKLSKIHVNCSFVFCLGVLCAIKRVHISLHVGTP